MAAAEERPRAVFDCMVFLQGAARRQSPAGLCLLLAERGMVQLCVSEDVLKEVAEVLNRPRVRAKFPSLTDAVVEELMLALSRMAMLFENVSRAIAFSRDPKDEPYLNLALAAQAEYLVSRDNDILDLNLPGDPIGAALRQVHPHLQILDPVAFIAAVKSRAASRE